MIDVPPSDYVNYVRDVTYEDLVRVFRRYVDSLDKGSRDDLVLNFEYFCARVLNDSIKGD